MSEKPPTLFRRLRTRWRSRSREDRGDAHRASTPPRTNQSGDASETQAGPSLARAHPEPAVEVPIEPLAEPIVQIATKAVVENPGLVPQADPGLSHEEDSSPKPHPSNAERLWDEAYDGIKNDDPKLVEGYERILSQFLNGEGLVPNSRTSQMNIFTSNDPDTRRQQMNKLIRTGLGKTAREAEVKDWLGTAMGIILSLKDVVNAAIAAVPQASIAWSGVCIALGMLESSVKETAMNRDGIEYVVTRIRWYGNISEVLLEESVLEGAALSEMKNELATRLVELYRALLLYQMKSVCSYFRNRSYSFLRDLIKLDNWAVSIQDIQKAEDSLRDDVAVFGGQQVRSLLDSIANHAKSQKSELQSIAKRLEEQLRRQITAEDQECLRALWSYDPYVEKKRIEDTKGGLLQDSFNWILENEDFKRWFQDPGRPLLWIRGDPGKGKTMLLCGIADNLQKLAPSSLVSFFFCQATDQRINNSTAILRGLVFLLIDQRRHLLKHVRERYVRQGTSLFEPPSAWYALSDILQSLLVELNDSQQPTCLLVDALDECVSEDVPRLLDFIVKMSRETPYVKWVVSSRNWQHIIARMERLGPEAQLSLELNAESVASAVRIYINQKVLQLSKDKKYKEDRERKIRNYLLFNADGTFLWVALVCQNLQRVSAWKALEALEAAPPGLEPFYRKMVQSIGSSDEAERCERILAIATVARRPLTLPELIALAATPGEPDEKTQVVRDLIGQCGSFLTIREEVVYFVHQSAKDFLSDMITKQEFSTGMNKAKGYMVTRSIQLMSQVLKRDIYQLSELGIRIDAVQAPDPDPLAGIGYSCVFWLDHFADLNDSKDDESATDDVQDTLVPQIETFIETKYLYWLEALSLLKKMPEGVIAMRKLQELFRNQMGQYADNLIRDAYRFILAAKQTIEDFPLQVYPSALMICPDCSKLRKLALEEKPQLFAMKHGVRTSWDSCLQTLAMAAEVHCVALSPDGNLLASRFNFSISVWDMATGTLLKNFKGPSRGANHVMFSPNSQQMAAVADDKAIVIWDIESSEAKMKLESDGGWPYNPCFSPDGSRLAAKCDSYILIWDPSSGERIHKLNDNQPVGALSFSPDGKRLISCSPEGAITVWDADGNCVNTLTESWTNAYGSLCIAPDISRVAFLDSFKSIGIFDIALGRCTRTKDLGGIAVRLEFFPNGRQLAAALLSNEIKIWDIDGDKPLRTFRGHSDQIGSIAISRDGRRLVSSSRDQSMKIWDVSPEVDDPWLREPYHRPATIALSPDGVTLALSYQNGSGIIDIWDTAKGEQVQTFTGHTYKIRHMSFSPDGRLLASASSPHHVRIWDMATGTCMSTLNDQSREVSLVKFSPDSCKLASVSAYEGTITIWDFAAGSCVVLECESQSDIPIDFNKDGTVLASGGGHNGIRIWDGVTGRCMHTLTYSPVAPTICLAFSPNGAALASGTSMADVRIWKQTDGQFACVQVLELSFNLFSLAFSPDGRQIICGSTGYTKTGVWNFDALSSSATFCLTLPCDSSSYISSTFGESEKRGTSDHCLYGLNETGREIIRNGVMILRLPDTNRLLLNDSHDSPGKTHKPWILVHGSTVVIQDRMCGCMILSFT